MPEMSLNWVILPVFVSMLVGLYFQNQNTQQFVDRLLREVDKLETRLDVLSSSIPPPAPSNTRPVALIGSTSITEDDPAHLKHVQVVLQRMGYQTILGVDTFTKSASQDRQFAVFWNHEYPFTNTKTRPLVEHPKEHQLINHVPGSGYYTSKVELSTAKLAIGLPLAFALPAQKQEFLDYSAKHPSMQWVQKSNAHRNIKVLPTESIDLDKPDTFLQKFIQNPLLIDKKKFDIGIYTVITSISPLRVYIYEGDALIRFCAKEYEPFDAEDVDKYVVGDDYTPVWEMPSLKDYFVEKQFTFKESLNAYLKRNEMDPELIWTQIREIIRQVFESQQNSMWASAKNYKNLSPYFELSRFDFVVDSEMTVFLMEANMSPNLSTGHFIQNRLLYEQVIFNVLSLLGLANKLDSEFKDDTEALEMQVSDRDIHVPLDECAMDSCGKCNKDSSPTCLLCPACLTNDIKKTLKQTFLEHTNRRLMRRVLPRTFEGDVFPMSTTDKIVSIWLEQKCQQNSIFCE